MLLKKKNVVINIPDEDKEKIKKYIQELGYNEYDMTNILQRVRRKRNPL